MRKQARAATPTIGNRPDSPHPSAGDQRAKVLVRETLSTQSVGKIIGASGSGLPAPNSAKTPLKARRR